MKIGISSLLYNLDNAIKICEQVDEIKHIELGIDNLDECEKIYDYIDRLNKLDISLSIHLPMEFNSCENIEYIRNSWVEFIGIMNNKLSKLNICYYNIHLGYVISGRLESNRKKYLAISSQTILDILNKTNIKLSIENTYSNKGDLSNVGNKVYDFEYIFNRVNNDRLWFCYDTGHCLINKSDYVEKLKNNIKVVHLSDNDGIEDLHLGINKGVLHKSEIETVIKLNPEFLILEINHDDVYESINCINNIKKEV